MQETQLLPLELESRRLAVQGIGTLLVPLV